MPKEKILYICDEKHNSQDAPLELKESVPYPENLNYGEKDSVHYYYQCPTCSRVYIAYQRVGKPLEWSAPARDVWEKRLNMVRDARINIVKKGLDEQKQEIERALKETARQLNEIALGKEGIIKEIEKKNLLLEQFKKDEQELSKKSARESEELAAITQKIDSLIMSKPGLPADF
jgi:DNA repair exonuclease SbcCD ATPase subunit